MRRWLIVLSLVLAACAPQVQPFHDAPESGARLDGEIFYAGDGAALPLRQWVPEGKPKAVILAIHGFNDYGRAFTYPGEFFKERRIAVYAYDQRGFGLAPGTGIWAGEHNLTNDLRQCVQLLRARHPQSPVYVLGESMGAAVTLAALADPAFPRINGAILVAPAVWGGDSFNLLFRMTLWMTAHTFPGYTLTGESLEIQASDNIEMLRKMAVDPLVLKETRADAIYGLVHLMDSAYEKATALPVPALVLYGERDEVIPRAPVEHIARILPGDAAIIYYPRGYHMLLRDLQRENVMRDILRWMENGRAVSHAKAGSGGV